MNAYIKTVARFLLLLVVIQVVRALMIIGMWSIFHSAPDSSDWAYMDMIAFCLIGMALISFRQPSSRQLALDWTTASQWERVNYIGGFLLVLGLVFSTYYIQPGLLPVNFNSVLIIPIFEEILFRGWGWTKLEEAATFKNAGLINWLVISILFGIWHFGYMDVYLLKVVPAWPDLHWGNFLLMKFITTLIIGLLVALPRWRTGRVQGSIILHALVNLFGR